MKKILVVLLLISMAVLSGCMARLPERQALAHSTIPNLSESNARVYFYMGFLYRSVWGQRMKGCDGELSINNKKVSYVNNKEAIVVDFPPGTYKIHWRVYVTDESNKDFHVPGPYELTVKAGDIVYLETNSKYVSSTASDIAGALGEAVAGAVGASTSHYVYYLEEEPVEGPKSLSKMTIVDYQDLSG